MIHFKWLFLCLSLASLVGCQSAYDMPRASLDDPSKVPEVVLYPGVPHRIGTSKPKRAIATPRAVCDDPQIVEFEEDNGELFAVALRPGKTLIRYPHDDGNMGTRIRVTAPELRFPDRSDIPRYLRGHSNPATFAKAINHYVKMGETRACRQLIKDSKLTDSLQGSMTHGIVKLCRVLFLGPTDEPLRGSFQGADLLPYQNMPDRDWPLLPIVEQDGTYFNMGSGFLLIAGGPPESVGDYLDYCQKNGSFRTRQVRVPTRSQAREAAEALFESERWIKLREEAARRDETFSEDYIKYLIRCQARSIY